jgi:heterodisulfide reductase subunit A
MGIEFVKGKIASISASENQNATLKYEAQEEDGRLAAREHDLVVLSLGIVPDWDPTGICDLSMGGDHFLKCSMPRMAPTRTDMEGVFVAGTAAGPKDIVDTIADAGAAAMEAANYLGK